MNSEFLACGGYRAEVAKLKAGRLDVDRSAVERQKPLVAGSNLGRKVMTLTEQIRAASPPATQAYAGELVVMSGEQPNEQLHEEGAA